MKKILGHFVLVLLGVIFPVAALDLTVWLLPKGMLPAPLHNLAQRMEAHQTPKYWRPDPYLRGVIKPGTDAMFVGDEFSFRTKTNLNFSDAGFRGGSLGGPVWGVAVGDSFTFGCCVDQEQTWVARLAELAHQEFANLGLPGYGPPQYTRTLEKYGLRLNPTVILYGLYTNDLADSVDFDRWSRGYRKRTPFKRFMKQHSAVYNLITSFQTENDYSDYLDVRGTKVKLAPRKLRDPYEVPPSAFESAWTLTVHQINRAIADARKIGAIFVLLYFPSKEEVYWDSVKSEAKEYDSFDQQKGKLRSVIETFCASQQIPCLDLTPALTAHASERQSLYYPVDIHWNKQGHQAVAEEINRFLRKRHIL
jgi:GDSL-like Lipase/Acylhydrolase family